MYCVEVVCEFDTNCCKFVGKLIEDINHLRNLVLFVLGRKMSLHS